MTKQELLDYLNGELPQYDALIATEQEKQVGLNQSITMQEQNIVNCQTAIVASQAAVTAYQTDKVYVNEIIVIVTAS